MKSKLSIFDCTAPSLAFSVLMIFIVFAGVGFSLQMIWAQEKGSEMHKDFEDFDVSNFEDPTKIDNEWFPLNPGTQLVYEGTTVEEDESVPHRVVFTVTDLTKTIAGVKTVVCWDQDYSAGELVETEIVFFAQDNDGTVWHLGQYPEEYEEGKFVDAPTWLHGFKDGNAGIMMMAKPELGTRSYSQGWAPSVDWTDRGIVYQEAQKTSVPAGDYEDVLVIDETSRSEPDAHQLKYYARGVGNVRVGWRGEGETTKETLELVKIANLTQDELEKARNEALQLEKRAYEKSKDVYANTSPMERLAVEMPD